MKQNKLLGVLAIALSLAITACGGAGGKSSKHVHTFDETKWEYNDTQHWHPATCEHKTQKGSAAAHTFGDPYDITQPTCDQPGSRKVKCSVCQAEVTQEIPATGHTFAKVKDADGNDTTEDLVTWTKEATCEEQGEGTKVCLVCQTEVPVTSEPLGHIYAKVKDADGNDTTEDVVVWESQPTCEAAGVGKKVCTRCGKEAEVTKDALGHKFEAAPDDGTPAPAGEAKVRMYTCVNGCGKSYFGFKAVEVTEASKSHLVFDPAQPAEGVEQGARFWGRPIGNDVALNDAGDPDRDSHDPVFNENQEGDFFEYVFTLTAAQAAELQNVRCFCDATPASYLGTNGIDFWANKEGDTDWTRGMYIDGDKKGEEITDYRYVLYVDDVRQDFDGTPAPVVTEGKRAEFEMPYTFNLHEGQNKISLRMAGGYRSMFYNFTFRTVEAPATDPAATTPGE